MRRQAHPRPPRAAGEGTPERSPMAARATALATRPGRRRLIVPNHHPSPTRRAKSVPNLRKGNAPHRCRAQTAPLPGDPRSPARSTPPRPGRPGAHRLTYSPGCPGLQPQPADSRPRRAAGPGWCWVGGRQGASGSKVAGWSAVLPRHSRAERRPGTGFRFPGKLELVPPQGAIPEHGRVPGLGRRRYHGHALHSLDLPR